MVGPDPAGPPRAKSSLTGIRFGWPTRQDMLEGARLLDAPPHHISGEETIQIAKDYEFLVLFTSTPGFPGDMRLAKAIKEANPNIKICFVGPHVTRAAGKVDARLPVHRLRRPQGIRLHGGRVRAGQAAGRNRGNFLFERRPDRAQSRPAADRGSGSTPARHQNLQARFGCHAL